MRKTLFLMALLLAAVQVAKAWEGEGTSANPYLIGNSADWKQLSDNVKAGNNYRGIYFRMTANFNSNGVSVGDESHPFSGIFDGDGYNLAYFRTHYDGIDDYCAPFILLEGATIRHFKTLGNITSIHKYSAGIASMIDGSSPTTIADCHVKIQLRASKEIDGGAIFGGIVGVVKASCTASPTISGCSFASSFRGDTNGCGGLVGYTSIPVNFDHCMFDPSLLDGTNNDCATFVRTAANVVCPMKDCYYTEPLGNVQGVGVFKEVVVPEGLTCMIETEPIIHLNGVDYWKSGSWIIIDGPAVEGFNHWDTGSGGCFVSNALAQNGRHQLRDISKCPKLTASTNAIPPKQTLTMDGTVYRYLNRSDYHLYLSDEYCAQKGYTFDSNDELYKGVDGTQVFVTAVTGWEPGKIPSDGAQIHNDLKRAFHDHTLTACIAPGAFKGCTELKTLYFKDTDANTANAMTEFDFLIGDSAFAYCSNLTEVKMMQYTTRGDNHWEALNANQVGYVGTGVFGNSPQAYFSTDATAYQSYMGSEVWKDLRSRIIIYNHVHEDMSVNGAKYGEMRNTKGESIKNDKEGTSALMETLKYWNADYRQFNAADLLAHSSENIWYVQVMGANDSYLSSNDGVMRIYNDPGSYYNYKTIAINSLGESKDVKAIEFWQTNGRSENSYSDLKMVIQNNAFRGCSNLKELRLFYYVQDGDDHWETLGPEDVIPGDNIFGLPTIEQLQEADRTHDETILKGDVPEGFRILVATERYSDFLNDPNWHPYLVYLEPVDFFTSEKSEDFTLGDQKGIKYGYITRPGSIRETSQVVSQDVSWWTIPRIAIEVVQMLLTFGTANGALSSADALAEATIEKEAAIKVVKEATENIIEDTETVFLAEQALAQLEAHRFSGAVVIEALQEAKIRELSNVAIELMQKWNLMDGAQHIADAVAIDQFLATADNIKVMMFKSFIKQSITGPMNTALKNKLAQEAILKSATKTMADKQLEAFLMENIYRNIDHLRSFFNLIKLRPQVLWSVLPAGAAATSMASLVSSACWSDSFDGDALQKGMRANILSNIHQVGVVGGGYVITTPNKNLVYHTYIKEVADDVKHAKIYAGSGGNDNVRTMSMDSKAFRDHKNLEKVSFVTHNGSTERSMPMLFTIPDEAFMGCTNLVEFSTLAESSNGDGTYALGPESFVLGGNKIFAGVDSTKFHIVIDPSLKDYYLANDSWAPLERFFVYQSAAPKTQYTEYGGNYAYAYENGSVQKVHKVAGHKIEHTIVTGPDTKFLQSHQGALKLCNDIGVFNNYQLDAVTRGAFKGNQDLRVVYFTDLMGTGAFGDSYTGLDMMLEDSCFAHCKNLADIDLLYMVTDGSNHIDPITPQQLRIGHGVLEGTTARFKMLPRQVDWFMADSSWVAYSDRFMPCIIKPSDDGIRNALSGMEYYDMAATGYDPNTWDEYIDLARIGGTGFSWLDNRFREQSENILSFADFHHFASVGLDYVGKEWFRGCSKMSNIMLPSTIKTIQDYAFASCSALQEIELPAMVGEIGESAFADCGTLSSIIVRNSQPAKLGGKAFPKNNGMKIYVPNESLSDYLTAWAEYKDYIVTDADYHINKVVKLDKAGTLAEKLGLYVEWSYSGIFGGDEPRYIHGNYAKYDSLTVSGPLNDLDLYVIRYLAGNAGYDRGGKLTDGRLRYLNLYDASIYKDKDSKAHYLNLSAGTIPMWYAIENSDELPSRLFNNCTALESIVLPKTINKMKGGVFIGCSSLRRLAITGKVKEYSSWADIEYEMTYPLEEMVMVTDGAVTSSSDDPWGQQIGQVFVKTSQIGDYSNQPYLTQKTENIFSPFKEDAVMETLASRGQFFPTEYLLRENIEGLFEESTIKHFDDFCNFQKVKVLERTFYGSADLKSITLPTQITSIGSDVFTGCTSLDTLRIQCPKAPELGENAFDDLPADFRILVPKKLCKLYRTAWPQYADHINVDQDAYDNGDIITVVLTEPNTLAEKLGLEANIGLDFMNTWDDTLLGVRGNYSHIRRLKVIGPISSIDFDLMNYLAGYMPYQQVRNLNGHLEYIDLYDANIVATDYAMWGQKSNYDGNQLESFKVRDNQLRYHTFLKAYNLKTLILPRTCKEVERRALQECEGLETLVIGDDCEEFNWDALADDASLTRMYILANRKVDIDRESWVWRKLCNNYNPTFDAFYVRPSQLKTYRADSDYTGSSWQLTNNIQSGMFTDDVSFCAFASHAAATEDDLSSVRSVDGWFDNHTELTDLTPLEYTMIDHLSAATLKPLTKLERISVPATLCNIEEGAFSNATNLRYVDLLLCDTTLVEDYHSEAELKKMGIDNQKTLVYVPFAYGESDGTNIVAGSKEGKFKAKAFRMVDTLNYVVPYSFETSKVENTRSLPVSPVPYTLCVPYKLNVPAYSRAYELSDRDGNTLVFKEVTNELESMKPYLLKVAGNKRLRKTSATLNTDVTQTIPANGVDTYGHQVDGTGYSLRGTFEGIDNATAEDLGAYILQSDGNWHPVSSATEANKKAVILPFRAFLIPSAHNANASISMELENVDGIEAIETIDVDGTEHYYDLQGRELPGKPSKGIYIHNGTKVVAQ